MQSIDPLELTMEEAVALLEKKAASLSAKASKYPAKPGKTPAKSGKTPAKPGKTPAKREAAPWRPSGYQLFSRERRAEGKLGGGSLTMKELAELWAGLPGDEVERYGK